ncbi:MAG TPA: PbsX family transcriptional regulator [Acetobacteraceae bacterium]|nr:PbsX family transcriptional regulator [Acetobacteraceae bacterium]
MRVLIGKWANRASVRIPAALAEAAGVDIDHAVDVGDEPGSIIVEPLHPPYQDLATLVAAITDENRHEEIDFGRPIGREAL